MGRPRPSDCGFRCDKGTFSSAVKQSWESAAGDGGSLKEALPSIEMANVTNKIEAFYAQRHKGMRMFAFHRC